MKKIAEFPGGELVAKALENGKPLQASCLVYKTNEEKSKNKRQRSG